jgi:FkbM family methyltransferase
VERSVIDQTNTDPRTAQPDFDPGSHVESHDLELRVLAAIAPMLKERAAVDVGAEHGELTAALLHLGCQPVHAVEPFPDSQAAIAGRFGDDPRVVLHGVAVSDAPGHVRMQVAYDPTGEQRDAFNALARPHDDTAFDWRDGPEVEVTTIAQLVRDGAVPARVGILKVDAEGFDLRVLSALGDLDADVVMFEHWHDLPDSAGRCPWTIDDMRAVLRPRGFHDFAFVRHTDEFSWLQWNSEAADTGDWGNVVFLHDRVRDHVGPVLWELAAQVTAEAAGHGRWLRDEAAARLHLLREIDERFPRTTGELTQALRERLHLVVPAAIRMYARVAARRILPAPIQPQLGRLIQHAPRPTTVPAWYGRPPRDPRGGWPSVQIVTPSYGQAQFIERTVRSVLAQRYPNLRYVVQDGGSKDATIEVLRSLESPSWSWHSERDDGQADAINRGFAGDDSELMGWLNADDLLLPGALHSAAGYLAQHPEVDVVYGHRLMIDEHDRRVGLWVTPPHDPAILRMADYVPQETLLWRRSLWERVGGLNASLHYALDWDLLLRFLDAGARIHRIPRFLGAFRVHEAQKTTATWDEVGEHEVASVRTRVNGHFVDEAQMNRVLLPYLGRHLVRHHLPHRALDAVPLPRIDVVRWLANAAA